MSEFPKREAERAVRGLKPFQKRTVDYVFHRLYTEKDSSRRFLVADETGLGKTMVARGVILRTLEHLWSSVPRIDVIYICSNLAIAEQNLRRLNVLGQQATTVPTRMTMLLPQLGRLTSNKVNLVSLTPGTTFNLRSSTGIKEERALLFALLQHAVPNVEGLRTFLQVGVRRRSRWKCLTDEKVKEVSALAKNDEVATLIGRFQREVLGTDGGQVNGGNCLGAELRECCDAYAFRERDDWPKEWRVRDALIGQLRSLLARMSVDMLEPDLIIMDEFQRFPELLHGNSDAAALAKELVNYQDKNENDARTLLLSATPYRMLSLSTDSDDEGDHYKDFKETLRFLYGPERGDIVTAELDSELRRFRSALFSLPAEIDQAADCKLRVEEQLRSVMARTERVGSTKKRDSMIEEPQLALSVEPEDLRHALAVEAACRSVDLRANIDYWKSAPYLLNFMRNYVAKTAMKDASRAADPGVIKAIRAARTTCLDYEAINEYREILPAHGRLRAIRHDIVTSGLPRRLWIPPCLPYYGDGRSTEVGQSKALLFSHWGMVPDAISALLSYESERLMGAGEAGLPYFAKDGPRRSRPLQFHLQNDKPTSLRNLLLTIPSPKLAKLGDPLDVVAKQSEVLTYQEMRDNLAARLRPEVERLARSCTDPHGASNWEWAGPSILDALEGNRARQWLNSRWPLTAHDSLICPPSKLGPHQIYRRHVDRLRMTVRQSRVSGREPNQFLDLLVDSALGSPAVCALRALRRVAPTLEWDAPALLSSSSRVAWGFLSLFNHPESVALLRDKGEDKYWHGVITYCARENLQAVLDEYVHYLVEAKALDEVGPVRRVYALADEIYRALAIRPSTINVDDPQIRNGRVEFDVFRMRGRFAMRFGGYRDDEGAAARVGVVRDAFNSPFRPFVLATTSIGQEGLDFHPYCKTVYHWNLPHNPVDMEQREGRVHRYKCHAVRLNVAQLHGHVIRDCSEAPADPWKAMFDDASKKAPHNNGLIPFWVYDGPAKVERKVPMLPLSREISQLEWLKKSLAAYRLAFGQPRQDDLLAYLRGLAGSLADEELETLQISLEPKAS